MSLTNLRAYNSCLVTVIVFFLKFYYVYICVTFYYRFIEKYGTHIIVGISIGGQDVILLKQNKSSNLEPSQLKNHLEDLGDEMFNGACTFPPHQLKTTNRNKV